MDDIASSNSSFSSDSTNAMGFQNLNSNSKLSEASNVQESQQEVPKFLEHLPLSSDEAVSHNGPQPITQLANFVPQQRKKKKKIGPRGSVHLDDCPSLSNLDIRRHNKQILAYHSKTHLWF